MSLISSPSIALSSSFRFFPLSASMTMRVSSFSDSCDRTVFIISDVSDTDERSGAAARDLIRVRIRRMRCCSCPGGVGAAIGGAAKRARGLAKAAAPPAVVAVTSRANS